MAPHLVRAWSTHKDIRICSFHHTHAHAHTRVHTLQYMHYWWWVDRLRS